MNKNRDELLQAWWAERRQSADIDPLQERIMQAVEEDRCEEPAPADRPVLSMWVPRIGYALAGAAALAVVLLAGRWFGGGSGAGGEADLLAMARVPPRELATGARFFDETARLFERRLMWISEAQSGTGMGIDSCPEGNVEDSPPAFVRVMVVERSRGEDAWEKVWKTDVIVRMQELAEIATNGDGKHKLMLWVYPLEDGHLLVDTDMMLGGERRLVMRESSIHRGGEPVVVASGQHGDTEYRVLQTVEKLAAPGGAG